MAEATARSGHRREHPALRPDTLQRPRRGRGIAAAPPRQRELRPRIPQVDRRG